jgi:hypothetical protein
MTDGLVGVSLLSEAQINRIAEEREAELLQKYNNDINI